MNNLIITNLYLFILALVLALLEIQIEGPNGWARNLPTWRPASHKWYSKLYEKIMSGKELTGYHLAMFGFVLLIFFFPYFSGTPFNLGNLLKTVSTYFVFIALWDFIWFVLNPFYPLKNFQKDNVNHKSWFLGMPIDYYFCLLISLIIVSLGNFYFKIPSLISWWVINVALFISETLILIAFSFLVLDIDNWRKKN